MIWSGALCIIVFMLMHAQSGSLLTVGSMACFSHIDHTWFISLSLGLTTHEYYFLFACAGLCILLALLRLAIEAIQFCRHPVQYLTDWVNWLEVPLYLCSIVFTYVFATPCLCVYSWQWQIGVVAVFLAWIVLISFFQKWPLTGVYVLMFVNVIGSFRKVVFLAVLLIIAFALAFYMLLFDPSEVVRIICNIVDSNASKHIIIIQF